MSKTQANAIVALLVILVACTFATMLWQEVETLRILHITECGARVPKCAMRYTPVGTTTTTKPARRADQ